MSDQKIHYVKSFSKGQITFPKVLRDSLGLGNEFWVKMYEEKGRVITEPVEKVVSKEEYLEKLKEIKGDWFDTEEWEEMRKRSNAREKLD